MKKPLKTGGDYLTNGSFNRLLLTKKQATSFAKNKLKSLEAHGCNNFMIIEKDDYFCISIW